ncbi:MAG: pyruvate, phosphate dikinase [Pseudomonadota bacterium]
MVYYFGRTRTDGNRASKELLGGKGKNLAEMTAIGLPVPPGFTITTDVCDRYYRGGMRLPGDLMGEVQKSIATLEKELGKRFGNADNPLLVSVRSGAAISMPGMLNTILNLGLNDESTAGLAAATGNERFAYDAYRRLINMYGDVVAGIEHHHFEAAFDKIKRAYKVSDDTEVPAEGLKRLCDAYKVVYRNATGHEFPQDPARQLEQSIEAVFGSWNTDRAISYRRIEAAKGNTAINDLLGTAVNVQAMVYGNMGDDSATGVGFTRDPNTGVNRFFGEFLVNAQGEDVVAGIRTPAPVAELGRWNRSVYRQLLDIKKTLETHYREMQDIEFTIERGQLFMLQTRTGKRNGIAAVKIACDMVKEGLLDEREAVLRVPAADLTHCLLPSFNPSARAKANVLCRGLNASPGAAVGKLAFTSDDAKRRNAAGETVILVRQETSPEDVEGMSSAAGILTSTGGATSHAAVVARGWGKCCVAGASDIHIDEKAKKIRVSGRSFGEKDTISIDGTTGEVMAGAVDTQAPKLSGDFARLMKWADKYRRLKIRTNADSAADSKRARDFGAQGIGLCRTEHMFFESDRIRYMRAMILAQDESDRRAALEKLLPFQRSDFRSIFEAMRGLPVTIRLLDPPLHEFLPHDSAAQREVALELGVRPGEIKRRAEALKEANPMLGHRGCRLSVSYPEILEMQVQAIMEAAIDCARRRIRVLPEIMIPMIGTGPELALLRSRIEAKIATTRAAKNFTGKLAVKIGTMIEVPRAALRADEIARHADFFSFGTNDLTQMTFGYSRDDVAGFLVDYIDQKIVPNDPFQSLDTRGVGQLIELGVKNGRSVDPTLKLGICGEHGGDPASIAFCDAAGLDYVSCSPFRVPVARLAAAQAQLRS